MASTPVFGIDLGTTNSAIARWINGSPEIVANSSHQNTTPSCVAFTEFGFTVGDKAIEQQNANPKNTIFEAKRIIGKTFETVQKEFRRWPFKFSKDENGRPKYNVNLENQPQLFYPEEISAMVLKDLKENAEIRVQQEVSVKYTKT